MGGKAKAIAPGAEASTPEVTGAYVPGDAGYVLGR